MPPKLTQPLRPVARYRKGQAPAGIVESDSESDQDEQTEEQHEGAEEEDEEQGVEEFTSNRRSTDGQEGKKMGVKLGNVKVDQQGQVKLPGQEEESSEYGKSILYLSLCVYRLEEYSS
jgi:microfibrillar-associated protein 1